MCSLLNSESPVKLKKIYVNYRCWNVLHLKIQKKHSLRTFSFSFFSIHVDCICSYINRPYF